VIYPERGAGVALRVHVDHEDTQPAERQRSGKIDGRRGLADAALLIGDRDDAR
jgi:hypothetical protein